MGEYRALLGEYINDVSHTDMDETHDTHIYEQDMTHIWALLGEYRALLGEYRALLGFFRGYRALLGNNPLLYLSRAFVRV